MFGYFIEISNANRHLVPADYQRRQTLTGAERYVTPALKEYEERVLTAAERIETRERELFEALRRAVGAEIARMQCAARIVAELDVLASLADVAAREGYARPTLTDDFELEIMAGRHPVVERMMPRDKFIPNDVQLTDDARLVILTGPNMAGKSTILRQVGLIVLMAQAGSFVPATAATIGVCDRVFTRVGRERQPRARAVHVHGGDGGDERHPAHARRVAASCCSTRSGAGRAPTTACRSRGR